MRVKKDLIALLLVLAGGACGSGRGVSNDASRIDGRDGDDRATGSGGMDTIGDDAPASAGGDGSDHDATGTAGSDGSGHNDAGSDGTDGDAAGGPCSYGNATIYQVDATAGERDGPGTDADQGDLSNRVAQWDAAVAADAQNKSGVSPFGDCVEDWPASSGAPAPALMVQPHIRWVASTGTVSAPISPVMSTTGRGVAVSIWSSLVVMDGNGTVAGTFRGSGLLSGVASDALGNLYVADSSSAYGLDPVGNTRWTRAVGTPSASVSEFAAPGPMVLSESGLMYLAALNGDLWVLDHNNGSVVASYPIGLTEGHQSRRIQMGVADVLFIERSVAPSGGPPISGIGIFSLTTGSWRGYLSDTDGWLPHDVVGGTDIGLVAYGYTNIDTVTSRTAVFDRCGAVRGRVPDEYAIGLAISFGDDLIVGERLPPSGAIRALRRFSRDGVPLAGPVSTDVIVATAVGADDTLYDVTCTSDASTLEARDKALTLIWSIPLGCGKCPRSIALGPDGTLFIAREGTSQIDPNVVIAVQTTSPGPALAGWGRYGRNSESTFWLGH